MWTNTTATMKFKVLDDLVERFDQVTNILMRDVRSLDNRKCEQKAFNEYTKENNKKNEENNKRLDKFEGDLTIYSNYLNTYSKVTIQDQIMQNLKIILNEDQLESIMNEKAKI